MTDRAYIVRALLERKIAFAENDDINQLIISLDVLKEILYVIEEQQRFIDCIHKDNVSSMYGIQEGSNNGKTL